MALNENVRVDIAAVASPALEIRPHQFTNDSGFVEPAFASLGAPFVLLRLYPAVLATLRASIGSVEQLGVREQQITGETVVFRGTAEARTEHLVSSGLEIDWLGLTFDIDGNPLEVSITADAAGQLKASQPFYGAAVVNYTTQYRLLKYRYAVTSTGSAISGGVTRITGGSVLAFHQGEVAAFDVPAPAAPQGEPDVAEVYRDVSFTILQGEDEFERPPNWPDSGDYLIAGLIGPDPDESWIEVERVHAKGKMEGHCRLAVNREFITAAKPFVGDSNYVIPIERIIASDDSLTAKGFSIGCIARAKTQIPEALG